jgi:hypothetical protein
MTHNTSVSSNVQDGYKEMAPVQLIIRQYILISALFHPQKVKIIPNINRSDKKMDEEYENVN